jgi:hypothetical protein
VASTFPLASTVIIDAIGGLCFERDGRAGPSGAGTGEGARPTSIHLTNYWERLIPPRFSLSSFFDEI